MAEANINKKPSYWTLENILKTSTAIIAILGFIYGVYQFLIQNERQYRQKIYETQLELYNEVMDLSSIIATTPYDSVPSKLAIENSRKFDEFYYGKMTLFEDTAVEKAMIDYKTMKDDFMAEKPTVTTTKMTHACLQLGYACRNSLQKTWGLQLEELNRNK
jgi:hypothetical protein